MSQSPLHRARSEQWQRIATFATKFDSPTDSCLYELSLRVETLEAMQREQVFHLRHDCPVSEEENDRRFKDCMAAIDNATPEQLHHAAPADNSRDTTEMVGPVATDADLFDAWHAAEGGLIAGLRAVYDLGRQQEAQRTEAQIAELRNHLASQVAENRRAESAIDAMARELKRLHTRLAELEAEPAANAATEPAPPQPGGIVRDGVSWCEREGREQFIQPAGPAEYQATQAAFAVGLRDRLAWAIAANAAPDAGASACLIELAEWLANELRQEWKR